MSGFIQAPLSPAPAGGETAEITGADGAMLRAAFFPARAARGYVVLATGWAEFIEKYFETIDDLRARGLSVAIMDWRGQGLSDRRSPREMRWVGYFDLLREDLQRLAEIHAATRFSGPAILMTHSMGGLPALKLLAAGTDRFARAVLCAPLTRLFPGPANDALRAVAGLASACGAARANVPRGKDSADVFDGNIFTSDPVRHEKFRELKTAEPRAVNVGPTFGWMRAALAASREIHAPGYFQDLKTPTLIVSAGAERQLDGSDHARFAAASDLISQVTIPGALHEIMMERDEIRAQYWKAFDDFTAPALP